VTAGGGGRGTARTPLYRSDWRYVEKAALNDFTAEEFDRLNAQRRVYDAEQQADAVLAMFGAAENEPSFGYQINHFEHGLQSATMLAEAGFGEEDVVVGLLHDIGFVACPDRHGAFAAELLGAYVEPRNVWMLRHHQRFGSFPPPADGDPGALEREQWRGHPHFDWTVTFVEEFDQNAIDPSRENLPLETFEPLLRRIFARAPRPLPEIDDENP
jgi:hypothetical protein